MIESINDKISGENYNTINLGPTHPATHGIFQNVLTMDGEKIIHAESTVGYIHRAFEKLAERRPYNQITPITDRLNYCSAPINNMGWEMTVEKLLGVQTPKRVDYMRVIIMELARIADHVICNSILAVDCGALTGFTYIFQQREKIYEIFEGICGARLTTNIGRIGGFERDFSEKTWKQIKDFLVDFPKAFREYESLVNRNRIFMDRTIGTGPMTPEMGLNYGLNKVRFPSPVPVGSYLRARMRLLEMQDISGGAQVIWQVTIERQGGDKPACVAESVLRLFV